METKNKVLLIVGISLFVIVLTGGILASIFVPRSLSNNVNTIISDGNNQYQLDNSKAQVIEENGKSYLVSPDGQKIVLLQGLGNKRFRILNDSSEVLGIDHYGSLVGVGNVTFNETTGGGGYAFFGNIGSRIKRTIMGVFTDMDISNSLNVSGTANITGELRVGDIAVSPLLYNQSHRTPWDYNESTAVTDTYGKWFYNMSHAVPWNYNQTESKYYYNASLTKVSDSDKLDNYDSGYFMPLNTTPRGNFDFNGGWTSGGFSVIGGDIYAQTGYFYNLSGLTVNTMYVNGSLIPTLFNNTFDIGKDTDGWWRSGYFGTDIYIGSASNPVKKWLYNQSLSPTITPWLYNQTTNSIYYYNQSLSPTITVWLYNQTTNSIYYYNQSLGKPYDYNQTLNSIYYYNQTLGIGFTNNWTGNSTAIWSNAGIKQVGIGTTTPAGGTLNVVGSGNFTTTLTSGTGLTVLNGQLTTTKNEGDGVITSTIISDTGWQNNRWYNVRRRTTGTVVAYGDQMWTIDGLASNGTVDQRVATIGAYIDGTPALFPPTRLDFGIASGTAFTSNVLSLRNSGLLINGLSNINATALSIGIATTGGAERLHLDQVQNGVGIRMTWAGSSSYPTDIGTQSNPGLLWFKVSNSASSNYLALLLNQTGAVGTGGVWAPNAMLHVNITGMSNMVNISNSTGTAFDISTATNKIEYFLPSYFRNSVGVFSKPGTDFAINASGGTSDVSSHGGGVKGASAFDNSTYGILGFGRSDGNNFGVYGYSATNYAGYFQGNALVLNNITIGQALSTINHSGQVGANFVIMTSVNITPFASIISGDAIGDSANGKYSPTLYLQGMNAETPVLMISAPNKSATGGMGGSGYGIYSVGGFRLAGAFNQLAPYNTSIAGPMWNFTTAKSTAIVINRFTHSGDDTAYVACYMDDGSLGRCDISGGSCTCA